MDIPPETRSELMKQKFLHLYWRLCFFKASKDAPPQRSFFGEEADALFRKPWTGDESSRTSLIEELGLLDSYREEREEREEEGGKAERMKRGKSRGGSGRDRERLQDFSEAEEKLEEEAVDEDVAYQRASGARGKMGKRRRRRVVAEEEVGVEEQEQEQEFTKRRRGAKAEGKRRAKRGKTHTEF
jgi:hypothetical protein